MTIIIALANDKGGVGKTTTTANLGAAFALRGRRVLLVDADPQGNLGEVFGIDDPAEPGTRLEDALLGEPAHLPVPWSSRRDNQSGLVRPLAGGVHVLPCTEALADVAAEMIETDGAEYRLADLIAGYQPAYDVVLIDTPPGVGALSTMALLATRWVVVPVRPSDLDVNGAVKIADRLHRDLREYNPDVELLGVLLTQVDNRWRIGWDTRRQLKRDGIKRLNVEIPFMVRVGVAPRHLAPTVVLEPDSAVGRAYSKLARQLDEALSSGDDASAVLGR
jgi:chromosome partitioning protein